MNSIEIARKMETDAIKFYTEAADKTHYPAGKKMIEVIIQDEKRHLDILSKIIKGLDFEYKKANPVHNVKTVFESMKDEMMKRVEASEDELDIFRVAMKMEKEGIEFYERLIRDEDISEKERDLFLHLIEEEKRHYAIFENTYNFLSDTGNWFMWDEHSIVDGGTPWA